MEIQWILLVFFVFVTLVFLAIAFLFPEWVGISGRQESRSALFGETYEESARSDQTEVKTSDKTQNKTPS